MGAGGSRWERVGARGCVFVCTCVQRDCVCVCVVAGGMGWGGEGAVVEPVVAGERTVYIEDPAAPAHTWPSEAANLGTRRF